MMRLSQKMTVKATTKPIISPNALLSVSNKPLVDAAITIIIFANTGFMPLSKHESSYIQLQRT
jgi:hypothetical protein